MPTLARDGIADVGAGGIGGAGGAGGATNGAAGTTGMAARDLVGETEADRTLGACIALKHSSRTKNILSSTKFNVDSGAYLGRVLLPARILSVITHRMSVVKFKRCTFAAVDFDSEP